MPEEGFLRRWARVKASGGEAVADAPRAEAPAAATAPAAPVPSPAAAQAAPAAPAADHVQPVLTLEDAARLTPESDFSAFVGQGVDKDVRRLALKKLFSDPHFNVPDRLDMYMDDYNQASPVSATMLAALQHARSALRRPEEVQAELARLAARDMPPAPATAEAMALEAAADGSGQDAAMREAGDAEQAGLEHAGEEYAGAADPDTPVHFEGAAHTPAVPAPVPAPMPAPMPAPGSAPIPAPSAVRQGETIALHSPQAHNAETSP